MRGIIYDHYGEPGKVLTSRDVGHLHIGLHSSIAAGFLADLRRRYRDKHSNVELVIAEGRSAETIRRVREGTLGIASETFLVRQGGSGPQMHAHLVRRISPTP